MTPPRRGASERDEDTVASTTHGPAASWRKRYDELLTAIEYTSWSNGTTERVHTEAVAHARSLCRQIYERNRMDREGPEVEQSHPVQPKKSPPCDECEDGVVYEEHCPTCSRGIPRSCTTCATPEGP